VTGMLTTLCHYAEDRLLFIMSIFMKSDIAPFSVTRLGEILLFWLLKATLNQFLSK